MIHALLPLLCVGWLIGVGWGSVFSPLAPAALGLLGIAGVAAAGLLRGPAGRAAGMFLLTVLLGAAWADVAARNDATRVQVWRDIAAAPVQLEGRVASREVRGVSSQVRLREVVMLGDTPRTLPGMVQATLPATDDVQENARLHLLGRVNIPKQWSVGSFDPERYFSRYGVFATLRFPRVRVIEEGTPSVRTRVREWLHTNIQAALPEPSAGLLSAMLLSYDKDLPRELRDVFAASGLAHLIAISGSHIALLAVVIFFGTTALGLSRLLASIATVLLSAAFLALVEFPASGIRSVLMVAVVFWAYASGRRVQGARALLLAAAVMTATNPRLLLGDIGFQLSVLAMWGLLVLYPFLTLPFRARRDFFNLRTIILLTLAAEIATAPLVAYTFGRLSVVGLLTNIVAIPLFPLLLVAGLVTATLGAVPVAQAFITPFSYGVATLFVRLGELAAEAPGARVPTGTVSPAVLLALYGGLLLVPAIFSPRTRRRFLAKSVAPPDGSHGVPTIPHTTVP